MIDKSKQNSQIESLSNAVQFVHVNLPLKLITEIDDYVQNDPIGRHHDSRTDAMKELLTIGLWFARKRNEFETIFKNPELMEELQSQLNEGGLVDFVQRMKWQEFQVVYSIFKNEAKSRKMDK